MNAIRWLASGSLCNTFPAASEALDEPNGLLAAGGDLAPERLLQAYRSGIFPWYEAGQPILWWSPDPRAVLRPEEIRISRSLRRTLAKNTFSVTADCAFPEVLAGCAAPRSYTDGTWITREMVAAYTRLHEGGWAHSFEAWQHGKLVGGLYGIGIGRVFFGESMFARVSDASKVAFIHALRYLVRRGVELVDCQVASPHLASLGASTMDRDTFLHRVTDLCSHAQTPGSWREDFAEAGVQPPATATTTSVP